LLIGVVAAFYACFLIPSDYFFKGYGSAYWMIFAGIPLLLILIFLLFVSPFGIINGIMDGDWGLIIAGPLMVLVSAAILFLLLNSFEKLGVPHLYYPEGKHAIPYVLASCAVVPGILSIIVFIVALFSSLGWPLCAAPMKWWLQSVMIAPGLLGVTLLFIPNAIVELIYMVVDFKMHYG
jgi:hypothetical protein